MNTQAAQEALLKNRSHSGFIARQVASYMGQIRCLTVPELRDLARRHQLEERYDCRSRLRLRR